MFAALTARLWYLQVLATQGYVEQVNNASFRLLQVEPERGNILDSRGNPLVENRLTRVVTVQEQLLGNDPEAVLFRLAQHLNVPEQDIVDRLQDEKYYDYQRVPVAVDVSEEDIFYIAEHSDEFPGVYWDEQTVRRYPRGPLAAHVLGQLGLIGKEEVNQPAFEDYGPNEEIGKTGLEKTYERFLHGVPGTNKIVVNPAGKLLDELGGRLPQPGDDVRLYLDSRLQAESSGVCRRASSGRGPCRTRTRTTRSRTSSRTPAPWWCSIRRPSASRPRPHGPRSIRTGS